MKLFDCIKYAFLVLVFFSCSKNTKEIKLEDSSHDIILRKQFNRNITIVGTSDNPEDLEFFNIIDDIDLETKNYVNDKEVLNDSLFLTIDSIVRPRLAQVFVTAASTDSIYMSKVFLKPGDTIKFEIRKGKLLFTGENSVYNNFYLELYNITPHYYNQNYKSSLGEYKEQIRSVYNSKTLFFEKYIEKHSNKISNEFVKLVEDDLKYEYLHNLINPRTVKSGKEGLYFVDPDGLKPLIEKEYDYGESLFNLSEYFDSISINDFKKPELIENSFFKNSLNSFIRYSFEDSELLPYSKEKFIAEKKVIEDNFDGDLKDYAIVKMFIDYHDRGFGHSINNVEFMKFQIEEYIDKVNCKFCRERLKNIIEELQKLGFVLPEETLNSELMNLVGDRVNLNEVFDLSKKRIKVIAFWASWCPPCIEDIIKTRPFRDRLSIENDIEWIYLSIDKDKDEWVQKSKELKEFLNVRNQYLLINGKNSVLGKSLNVKWIPRYVILNRNNEIILENSPKPSDTISFKKIVEDLSKF